MLSAEDNDRLCQVGPGTPVGEALRRYWVPAFQLGDLPVPDCPPIRVRVLGEDFVAFRDTAGRFGFLDELCCHRNASLAFGRVEDHGIRCLYHGWKYDVDGAILEMPNCDNPRLKERIRQGSYPVVAAGGLGWVYLGPPGSQPDFPRFPWTEAGNVAVNELVFDCNWVQIQEGSLDSSHVGILHLDTLAAMQPGVPRDVGSFHFDGARWDDTIHFPPGVNAMPSPDNAPRIDVEATPYGFQYAAVRRSWDEDHRFVRVTAFAFPFTAHIGGSTGAVIVVPRDDDNCSFIAVRVLPAGTPPPPPSYAPVMPPTATTAGALAATTVRSGPASGTRPGGGNGSGTADAGPGSAQGAGADGVAEWVLEPTEARRYQLPAQDRRAMAARVSFAGFRGGNRPQDAAVQGVNARRSRFSRATENLVPADAAILRFRRLLLEAADAVAEGREPPARAEGFDCSGVRSASETIDATRPWQELVPGNGGRPAAHPA